MNQKSYFDNIDGLRAYACLVVLFYHAAVPGFGYGWIGVQIFFCISGFLITDILLKSKNKIIDKASKKLYFKRFYYRRALRIVPIYFLLLLVVVFLGFGKTNSSDIIYYFLYIQNRVIGFKGSIDFLSVLGHTWTLAIERQFYLFWPLLVLFLDKKKLLYLCVILFILSFFLKYYGYITYGGKMLSYGTFSHLDTLLGGAVIAILYNANFKLNSIYKYVFILNIFCFILYILLGKVFYYDYFYINHITSLDYSRISFMTIVAPFAMLVLNYFLIADNRIVDILFKNRYIKMIGEMSYGVYLYHLIIYVAIDTILTREVILDLIRTYFLHTGSLGLLTYLTAALSLSIKLFVTLGISYLSYNFIEKKILVYKDRV